MNASTPSSLARTASGPRRWLAGLLPTLLPALLVACAVPPADSAPAAPPTDPLLRAAFEQARADVAPRAGVPVAQVQLLRADRVTWPDGSLGCPEPGVMYTQALVPGVRLVLRAGGRDWAYHGSERGGVAWCPRASTGPAAPGATSSTI